jgi:hypothetical protein
MKYGSRNISLTDFHDHDSFGNLIACRDTPNDTITTRIIIIKLNKSIN